MIELGGLLASGTERDVYRHPFFPDRVIKVGRKTSHVDRNAVESNFFRVCDAARFPQLPKFYGWVDTCCGPGVVYELITDRDGNPSMGIPQAIKSGIITPDYIAPKLLDFIEKTVAAGLMVYDVSLSNILCRNAGETLHLIDGFGPHEWNFKAGLRSRFPSAARKKTRQWADATHDLWRTWLAQEWQAVQRQQPA